MGLIEKSWRFVMFCPRCGTENLDTNKYCRNCREHLQPVAHAMNSRLPVLLFTKIDTALNSKSERFRRDSALWFLFSASHFLSAFFGYSYISHDHDGYFQALTFWRSVVCSGLGLISGIWSYLAFRHSLLLGREILLSDNASSSIEHNRGAYSRQPDSLAVEALPLPGSDATRQTTKKLPDMTDNTGADDCSSCEAESSSANKFCRRCGANLQLLRKITRNSRLQTWLDSMLDWYVRTRSNPEAVRVGAALFMFAVVYLLFIVSKIARKGIDWTLWFDAAFMFPFLVIGAWDYLHYRALRKDNANTQEARLTATLAPPQAVPEQVNAALTTDRLPSPYPRLPDNPLSATENTTRQLIDRSAP